MSRKEWEHKRKMLEQKLVGVGLLVVSAVVIYMGMTATLVTDQDITPALLFIPLGLALIFSKECWIY